MGELGDRLRQAREARGWTLEQAEEVTKIRRRYLQALEEEDYGQLPAEVFVRGFLRNYALALDLDPREVLVASGRQPASPVMPTIEPHEPLLDEPLLPRSGSNWMMAALIGVMVLVGVVLGAWALYRYFGPTSNPPLPPPEDSGTQVPVLFETVPGQGTAQPLPTATTTPTPSPTSGATATPAMGVQLRIEATDRSWVRITVDGGLGYEGFLDPGQAQEWSAANEIFLRTGNAGGLRLWYNGQEQPSLGAPGDVVEHTWSAAPLPAQRPQEAPTSEGTPGPLGTPPAAGPPTATPTLIP